MIQIDKVSLAFGQQVIFDHISCNISPNQKLGLVGSNGSGKSTLLKVITGLQHMDSGQVSIPKDFRCAFMPQDVVLVSKKTIVNEALNAFPDIGHLLDQVVEIEKRISNGSASEQMLEQYAAINHQLYEMDYESKRAQAENILAGLGFSRADFKKNVSFLSVGWKMRLVLASLLLQNADFYLFDEPTNHLDLFAKDWFVEFLRNASFGFILVAHDEYVLNKVCNNIGEMYCGKLKMYKGGYQSYKVQKRAGETLLEKKYEDQQKLIKKKQATIDRFRAQASKAKMVKSMAKSLKKIEPIKLEQKQKSVSFRLGSVKQSGKVALEVKNLSFSFEEKSIFNNVTFQVLRGHKVAIVAPNGIGKTTLLNVIMQKYTPKKGTVSFGYNVEHAFFEQDQNQSLVKSNTIIQEVEQECKTSEERSGVRSLLGAFLFSGEDTKKKIEVLSGGEKNRVAMVKVLLKKANFLILDEPTNHLDITSKQILLNVLSTFKGTILFVSHDRTFLNSLATDIFELTPQGLFSYSGNYDDYLYQKQHALSNVCNNRDKDSKKVVKKTKKSFSEIHGLRKKIKKVENSIKRLEDKIAKLSEQFVKFSYGSVDYKRATTNLRDKKDELEKKNASWEELMMELCKLEEK